MPTFQVPQLPFVAPSPINVVAGNTLQPVEMVLKDPNSTPYNLSEYTWSAIWRPYEGANTSVHMSVNSTQASLGTLFLSATAAETTQMGRDGIWGITGVAGQEVTTWVVGQTDYELGAL